MPVDIRLISASNLPLAQMTAEGTFRQDLLYRINTVEIVVPPLRERNTDIPVLADYFLRKYSRKYNKSGLRFSNKVITRLSKYHWPGNVRELQHAIERAVILCGSGTLAEEDFQFPASETLIPETDRDMNLEKIEKWAVQTCLRKHGGHISKTAAELGLTRGALYRRLEKYGL
jgi:transcriptional regulator with PAS, ATPase and Fis domain